MRNGKQIDDEARQRIELLFVKHPGFAHHSDRPRTGPML
jgi:hypothetical protein